MTFKNWLFIVLITGSLGLFSCGQVGEKTESTTPGTAPHGLAIKYPEGMATIPFANVVSVDVTVFPPIMNPNNSNQSRSLTGPAAKNLLESAGLDHARKSGPAAAMKTGHIVVSFRNQKGEIEKRTFNILNERLLEDSSFPEVTYQGSLILDRYWLDGLPAGE